MPSISLQNVRNLIIEATASTKGSFGGLDVTHLITYWIIPRARGIFYGESKGVITTIDGTEIGTEEGRGIGRFTGPGSMRVHGSSFFRTLVFFKWKACSSS